MPGFRGRSPRAVLGPGVLAALGFVGMAGSLSTDLYLPSFPDLQSDLGVDVPLVQLTLTAFLAGAAIGQFFTGVISDALGRRTTLIGALAAFTALSVIAAFAPNIQVLIALRFAQGVCASAGAALSRAVVGDLATGEQTTRAMSLLIAMLGLGPAVGNPLGAVLAEWGGWRAALGGLAAFAALMTIVAYLVIPESLPIERRHPARFGSLVRNVRAVLGNPAYVFFAASFALSYGALMVYIGSSSFLVQGVLGADPAVYAMTFAAGAVSYVLGALGNARLARRIGTGRALATSQAVAITAASAIAVCAALGALTVGAWVALLCPFMAGVAGAMSNSSALSIGQSVGVIGAGSALLGLVQFSIGAVATLWGGWWGVDSVTPTAIGMAVFAVAGLVAGMVARVCAARREA